MLKIKQRRSVFASKMKCVVKVKYMDDIAMVCPRDVVLFAKLFQVMGRVICLWRGEWKKNREHEWHFFLDQTDFVFRVLVDENESFQTLKDLSS